jgi:hypothetical protein
VTSSMKSKLVVLSEGLVTATHKMIRLSMEDSGLHERHMVSHQNNMVGGFFWKKVNLKKSFLLSFVTTKLLNCHCLFNFIVSHQNNMVGVFFWKKVN